MELIFLKTNFKHKVGAKKESILIKMCTYFFFVEISGEENYYKNNNFIKKFVVNLKSCIDPFSI